MEWTHDRFSPTPQGNIEPLLDLLRVGAGSQFIDLGSGDGRLLGAATQRGAIALGYEIDEELVSKTCKMGLNVLHENALTADLSNADCVIAMLETQAPAVVEKARREMRPGTRLLVMDTLYEW